jgi:hypothetical protein
LIQINGGQGKAGLEIDLLTRGGDDEAAVAIGSRRTIRP